MKRRMKKLMGIMLGLVMVLGMMAGTSTTALAYDGNPYAGLVSTTTPVTFHGTPWYIIEDNSTAKDAGTVTLLVADESFRISNFSDSNNDYSSSTVKSVLDAYTAPDGKFADVADAIETNTDAGGKLYLLSTAEARKLPRVVLKSQDRQWWLRSPGNDDDFAAFVDGKRGIVDGNGDKVGKFFAVRPALKLKLSSVIFKSESGSYSFELKPSNTNTPSPEDIVGLLPPEITMNDEDAVNTAVEAYLALTDSQKADFSEIDLQKLIEAETAIGTLRAAEITVEIGKVKNLKGGKVRMHLGNPHYNAVKDKEASAFKAQEVTDIDKFYIQYSTDKEFKKGVNTKKIKNPNTRTVTIKHLKKGKTYYFRTCTYTKVKNRIDGNSTMVKGKWSAKKRVEITR